jgi:hypothetical protein
MRRAQNWFHFIKRLNEIKQGARAANGKIAWLMRV